MRYYPHRYLYIFLIFTVLLGSWHHTASAQNVTFPDENLAAAVRSRLGLEDDDDITQTALLGLTTVSFSSKGITNLIGLEYATNLTFLQLRDNPISDFSPISSLINLESLNLIETGFSSSDLAKLQLLENLENLFLSINEVSDLTYLPEFPNLLYLGLRENGITTITPLGNLKNPTNLKTLTLNTNEITDVGPLAKFTGLTDLYLALNKIRDVTPLGNLTNLTTRLRLQKNRIRDVSPLATLTQLGELYIHNNQISDFSPLKTLTALKRLTINCNQYTDISEISPLKDLPALVYLRIDEVFYNANKALVEEIIDAEGIDARSDLCPEPEPEPELELESESELELESESESEPKVKQRKGIAQCGLGWSPHSQYQHHGELPKVMIYALEFEYDPASHGRYSCKTIEIRTGDDSVENLAGWNLYLGTLYNPSSIPLKIPEEHSQITGRILRITPEMLGLETFPCNTVNGISHPLPGVQYVLKTDENVLIDTAYSCFVWGQNAYTTVNDKNVESPRRISSQALREMDTPRIERYITNPTGIFITDIPFEDFAWDRAVLSDWLLPASEASAPGAPSAIQRKLVTTWGALKK